MILLDVRLYLIHGGAGEATEAPSVHHLVRKVRALNKVVVFAAMICFGFPALAAGVDSRAFTCPSLQALIAQYRFVFIGNPDFQDFVVSNSSVCSGPDIIEPRTVPTIDNPQCLVNYCRRRGDFTGGGGG